jgi:hypothetical protein
MAYLITDQIIGSQPVANTDTTQQHPLGTTVRVYDPDYGEGVAIYLLGVASTAATSWVTYNPDDFSTALLVASARGSIAVSLGANVASSYGWYLIKGKVSAKALTGYADNADVYATSTAGSVDDAVVTGDKVLNARGASAVSGGVADFEIDYPHIDAARIIDSTAVTSSGTELNILDGVTSTTAELNILDGVTATATELNYLDIATLGTGAASKAVVLDAGDDYTWPATGILTYGGGAINATGAEITAVCDKSASVVDVTGATVSLTSAAHAERYVTLSRAAGVTVTLPAATGTGNKYTIITATTVTSNNNIIQAASASDSFVGICVGVDTDGEGATGFTWNADSGDDTITMDGSAKGGIAGDLWEIIDYASGLFLVKGRITQSGGSEATPFSAAVS